MAEQRLTQWERADGKGATKVHVALTSWNDREGRTACGKRYLRQRELGIPDPLPGYEDIVMCRNCRRASGGRHGVANTE